MASESGKQLFRKKWSVLLIALTIIGSIVSGCGNNNNEDTEAKKDLVKAEKKIEELEKQLEEVKGELVLAQAPKEETVDEAATGTTTHEPAPAPAPAPAATPATTAFENPLSPNWILQLLLVRSTRRLRLIGLTTMKCKTIRLRIKLLLITN
ncbi:hypothetical protein [Bacillus sp. V33-4]|uniref:hypothetical protein n=1 Tax=Bacillus sp. V33-4 TaxID=2054169 RepID=UPI000C77B806|nr:hypothetical protein [Bacillus sp. V33-4]PLR87179.1 hypothetical protein CVD23_04180 [Bacillus sp. V33-4]